MLKFTYTNEKKYTFYTTMMIKNIRKYFHIWTSLNQVKKRYGYG